MIGDHETVHDDLPLVPGDFTKLTVDTSPPLDSQQLEAVAYLNGLRWVGPVNGVPQLHVAAMVTSDIRGDLLIGGFGQYIDCGTTLIAFAEAPCFILNMQKPTCPRTIKWWATQYGPSFNRCPGADSATLEYQGYTDKGYSTGGWKIYELHFKAKRVGESNFITADLDANLYCKDNYKWTLNEGTVGDTGYECAACHPVTPGFVDPPSKSRCNPNCYKITACGGGPEDTSTYNCY
jgi:hypothetical protein